MKKIKEILRGFITDFWMLPVAAMLIFFHNNLIASLQLMPSLNDVKVGNIIPTLVVFLLVMSFVRAYFYFQYPDVYGKSLIKKNGELWEKCSSWQQFLVLRLERWVLLIVAALTYLAMF